ncbi:TPA: hypothetical protein OXK63_001697 [Acinetobacter baumannii]|nr:hypothetical protein [Acinetobacter baumannii]EKU8237841.1 hypothetical protein [Acinetobacter baumannii]EKU8309766.1 hypothetical protein [Acinetobacter baumannii]EKU8413550.1 hypothetical protein [Acinetobacter baumannii]EKU9263340.1 hypothetical protein [Acinetobacter baumannii]
MPAVLEIYNPDGSLRFSSERFKVLKYDGEFTPLENMNIQTNGDWSSRWQVQVTIKIPAAKGSKGLAFIPWLTLIQPQGASPNTMTFTRILRFPQNINRDQLWEFVRRPGFTVSI